MISAKRAPEPTTMSAGVLRAGSPGIQSPITPPRESMSTSMWTARPFPRIPCTLPGSPKACREVMDYILDDLKHGIDILKGDARECARK